MSKGTAVGWTDWTLNGVTGCDVQGPGCAHCFAARLAATRLKHVPRYKGLAILSANGTPQWTGEVRIDYDVLAEPVHTMKPHKIFWTAYGDPFHAGYTDQQVAAQFGAMALAPHHTFQALTKRIGRAAQLLPTLTREDCVAALLALAPSFKLPTERQCKAMDEAMRAQGRDPLAYHMNPSWPLPHVWLGTSIENQEKANERAPLLVQAPAAVRFVSLEPLLEFVDLSKWLAGIDWVIPGGESGPRARPNDLAWVRSIVEQCRAAGKACFVKQLGKVPVENLETTGNFRTNQTTGAREFEMIATHVILAGKHTDIDVFPEDLRVQQFPA